MQAEAQLKQARGLDVPGEMKGAQQALLMALEFRRDGLGFIAERIRTALGDEGEAANDAITEIAGAMQMFLTSDVLYQSRTSPLIKDALNEAEIGGQQIATSRFLPGIEWLSEQTVAAQLGQQISAGDTADRGEPAPGLHGTGIESVAIGDTALQPDAPNRVAAGADTPIVVKFTNQGENDEFDVKVTVSVEGGDKPIKASRTVDTVARGQTAEASLTLGKAPPVGAAVTVKVDRREGARRGEDGQQHLRVRRPLHRGLSARILKRRERPDRSGGHRRPVGGCRGADRAPARAGARHPHAPAAVGAAHGAR